MKTLADLYQLMATATESDRKLNELRKTYSDVDVMRGRWFVNYSGHVNQMRISYYPAGWSADAPFEKCEVDISVDGIQEAYWFIKNRLA
jgi:hypothetical protein